MTTTAQSVILEVQTTLVDRLGTRWPASELVRALNDMQRVIADARPDSTAARSAITLAAGVDQTIPTTAQSLLEVTNLTADTKGQIRVARREDMDAISPTWRNDTQSATIRHYMVDARRPRSFEVWPPAIASTQVDALLSMYPTDVAAPSGAGKQASTVSGNISLADEFKEPLKHLVLFCAYAKDAEYGANSALATGHLAMAEKELGVDLQGKVATGPKAARGEAA